MLQTEKHYVQWHDQDTPQQTRWLSESKQPPPAKIVLVDDQTTADHAYRLACEGNSLVWRGDFHNARQLLQAMTRRIERTAQRRASKAAKSNKPAAEAKQVPNLFHQQRHSQAQRASILSRLLLQLDAGYVSCLRRAPELSAACTAAFGELDEPCLISLRDVQGEVGRSYTLA